MRMKAERFGILPAALLFVSSVGAAEQVVATDGTIYSVNVVELCAAVPEATALSFSVLRANGALRKGFVAPTLDKLADQDPQLVLDPSAAGPFLVWSRNDGLNRQIAYSRFAGDAWADFKFLTWGAGDHVHPAAGVDSHGTGYVVWVEPSGSGSVVFATFDPGTGRLLTAPRDLLLELVRHSPPEILSVGPVRPVGPSSPDIVPDGGSDVPNIPPGSSNNKKSSPPPQGPGGGVLTVTPTCSKAAAAVVKERALWIGVFEGGVVIKYYRSTIPQGAPDDYVSKLLQGLLDRHCSESAP